MSEGKAGAVIAWVLASLQAVVLVGAFAFKAFAYGRLPVSPGDPYGIGDILELGIFVVLVALAGLSLLAAALVALVPRWRRWNAVAALAAAGLLCVPLYLWLEPLVPRLR